MTRHSVTFPRSAGEGTQSLPLEIVCQVRSGYVAPATAPRSLGDPSLRALQPSDITENGLVAWPTLRVVPVMRDWHRYAVREGDVLLPLRSMRLTATVARDVPGDVIALGHWALLSTDAGTLTPDYLAWYLNHPETAQKIRSLAKGSNLQFLSLSAIRSFQIEAPSVSVQGRIVRVHECHERAKRLELELSEARQRLIDAATINAVRSPSTSQAET